MDQQSQYQQFQHDFPYETLSSMTLEQYTNLDQTSFCYALEHKTKELGGIGGGSSYKFGIYQYLNQPKGEFSRYAHDEKYAWISRLGNTAEEVFEKVRNSIVEIAKNARVGYYDVIDSSSVLPAYITWKIAFLYSEEKLLPIYDKSILALVAKDLGMSNAEVSSQYKLNEYLLSLKAEGKSIYDYYSDLWQRYKTLKGKPRVWLYAPGEKASLWEENRTRREMCLGWDDIPDLSEYRSKKEVKDELKKSGSASENPMNDALALWQFYKDVKEGDIVYAKMGTSKILGRGVVKGEYAYDDSRDTFRHIREVDWANVGEWTISTNLAQKAFTQLKDSELIKSFERLIESSQDASGSVPRYWWLVASPKIFSLEKLPVGKEQEYSVYNENGHARRIPQNFADARVGDCVIGYEANPKKKIVALMEVSKASDGNTIAFKKVRHLSEPIPYSMIKENPALANMEFLKNRNGTLFKLTTDEYEELMEIISEQNPVVEASDTTEYGKENFLEDVYMSGEDYDRLVSLLQEKKNIILQGAPGVGKTYSAKRLAYSIIGKTDKSHLTLIQFHQNYSYEDFVLGYKPNENGGFELREGVFYKACRRAQNDPDNDYFFIIDEINRGNMSKIFGELLMLIEKDYRTTELDLAYNGEPFSVPNNLYIIGMMNTADRSLAMIDYALRRRFSFFDMRPGFGTDGFKKYQASLASETFNKVIEGIVELNKTIEQDTTLGSGFCIGHSYFCNKKSFDKKWLQNVIDFDIAPMLKEYWFDDTTKAKTEVDKLSALLK